MKRPVNGNHLFSTCPSVAGTCSDVPTGKRSEMSSKDILAKGYSNEAYQLQPRTRTTENDQSYTDGSNFNYHQVPTATDDTHEFTNKAPIFQLQTYLFHACILII